MLWDVSVSFRFPTPLHIQETYQHCVKLHLLEVDVHPGSYANLRLDRVNQPGAVVVAPVGLDDDSRGNGDLDDAQVLLPRLADLR